MSSRTVDPVTVAPSGGEQRLAGDQAQPAPGTPYWSTKFLLDPMWDAGGFLIQQAKEIVSSLQGDAREASAGTPHGRSVTQRGPPLRIPVPFSGLGPVMGAAATGIVSSGNGGAPLLAVIVSFLFALLLRDRSRAHRAFLRPGTVPRLALERPG